jgi:hypothetical protein
MSCAPENRGSPREVAKDVLGADWNANDSDIAVIRQVKASTASSSPWGVTSATLQQRAQSFHQGQWSKGF